MRFSPTNVLILALASCGNKPVPTSPTSADASDAATASKECLGARDLRTKAMELHAGGHESLALAKLGEANAACAAERDTTKALEDALLSYAARWDAPSKGTEDSMRQKMREGKFLEAWAELHPNPRALENAARVATDPAESRRLRDRALAEAEELEKATAIVTERVRVTAGVPRLLNGTLLLAQKGKVVARDTKTGELRVLVDGAGDDTTLSPKGTLALSGGNWSMTTLSVADTLTGKPLFKVGSVGGYVVSPDDTRIAAMDEKGTTLRVIDVATNTVKSKLSGSWTGDGSFFFAPDADHLLVRDSGEYKQWDVTKGAYGAFRVNALGGTGVSLSGRTFAWTDQARDGATLHVRDMVDGKDIASWTGTFHSVETLAVTDDGKTLATGSYNSLRLWDVATKKQLFKHERGDMKPNDPKEFAFSDDGKTMVLAGWANAIAWDVATGAEKPLVTTQNVKKLLRVVQAPDGVALVIDDEVRILPATGEPRTVCRGLWPTYGDVIGPTNAAFSASGKSFACAMSDGWFHVFETTTWTEKTVIKKGAAQSAEHPVDLLFGGDDALTVVGDKGFVTYDASSGAEKSKVTFKHPSVGLAGRHARFDDGTIGVRLWNGSLAIFDAAGAWQRDVKLPVTAPMDAVDAFSSDGKVWAVAIGKKLHVVDLGAGTERAVDLSTAAKSIATNGKTVAVAGADGVVSVVTDSGVVALPKANGSRVWLSGKATLVSNGKDTVDAFAPDSMVTLEIDPDGVAARDGSAFETRGKPEVACLVGKTWLSRETCADRAKPGLVEAWVKAVR